METIPREILTGWVTECTAKGIKVRMEFFDEIWIPKDFLFENCKYSELEQAWIYLLDENELFIDVNEKIRFRVEEENFYNVKPKLEDEQTEEEESYYFTSIHHNCILSRLWYGVCFLVGLNTFSIDACVYT